MSSLIVTRGLGGSATSLLSHGFISTFRRIIKGGRRFAERAITDLEESFKISVMLLSANGKELSKPIVSNMSKVFRSTSEIVIRANPKKLKQRKANRIKVTAKLRNQKDEQNRSTS